MLDKALAADVLAAALSTGGDFAEIYVENNQGSNINMVNGLVEKAQSGIEYGAGVRIFNGFAAVYAYTNDTSRENLLKVAKEAAGAVKKDRIVKAAPLTVLNFDRKHQAKMMFRDVPKGRVTGLMKEASAAAFAYDAAITQTTVTYLDTVKDVLIVNSEGIWAEDRRVRTRLSISSVASSASEKQTGSAGAGASQGFEFYDDKDMKAFGRESARQAVTMLKADPCPGGKMPVIIGNGFGGVIFHEACGHPLEATSVARGASVFCGKMGTKIANEKVTAIDDGTIPGHWGSLNIDDEGHLTQRNVLIEKGILKSYLIDKLGGLMMNAPSTGSSRRQNYQFAPTSRMTNTYIDAGEDSFEDMVSSVELGLHAKKMGGGSVTPGTGEFNFAVTEAYMIRNGKVCEPVRGATLIGKGHEILMNITMVGKNLDHEQGMCGSRSGTVPTNCGQPDLLVSEILVGGRGKS